MRVGSSARSVLLAVVSVQVVLALAPTKNDGVWARLRRQVEQDGRVGGFGRGVGRLDVSLGAHPSLLEDVFSRPPPPPKESSDLRRDESSDGGDPQRTPPIDPFNRQPPNDEPTDQQPQPEPGDNRLGEKGPVQMQTTGEKGHDCTVIVLERLNKRCCRLPVLVPQKMIDNCTIRDDVSPEYSKRFKNRRGPRRAEDGALDILQITVQLEAAASDAWKPMIRETILSCNDLITAKISDENMKTLQTLSGQNCSVLPWLMLKCLKKAFFLACPDAEVINKDADCSRDMRSLQGCNPFTLTNTSSVKPASRPETAANDAFELLKPATPKPNASDSTHDDSPWAPRAGDAGRDRRFDLRRHTSTTQGYGTDDDRGADRRHNDFGQDMESGASNMNPVLRGRLPPAREEPGGRDQQQHIARDGMAPAPPSADDDDPGSPAFLEGSETHENVQQKPLTPMDAGRRMDEEVEDQTREDVVFQTSTTVLYESIKGPEKPRRFDSEGEDTL